VPSMLTLTILPAPDAGGQSGPVRREERKIGYPFSVGDGGV